MAGYQLFCFGNPGLELDGQPVKLEHVNLWLCWYICAQTAWIFPEKAWLRFSGRI